MNLSPRQDATHATALAHALGPVGPVGLGAPPGVKPKKSGTPVEDAAAQLGSDACPYPTADVQAFQLAWNAQSPAPSPTLVTNGVFDDNTLGALFSVTGTAAPCPSANLTALANQLLADTSVSNGLANANVATFMQDYAFWQNPVLGSTPPIATNIYNASVQAALTAVLGTGTALPPLPTTPGVTPSPSPAPSPTPSPSPSPTPGSGTTAITNTTTAAPASNTAVIVASVVGAAAIGGLVYVMMAKGTAQAVSATVRAATTRGARPNPSGIKKASLLRGIRRLSSIGEYLRLGGFIGGATGASGYDRVIDKLAAIAERNGLSDDVLTAEEEGRQEGRRLFTADPTNAQGYPFPRWLDAAHARDGTADLSTLLAAWKRNEDPRYYAEM